MFWQPDVSEGWDDDTARIAYQIDGEASLLFVVRTEDQTLGVLQENASGTVATDGQPVPLTRTPPGRSTLILRVYDDRNEPGLDDTDIACEGQDTAVVNLSSST